MEFGLPSQSNNKPFSCIVWGWYWYCWLQQTVSVCWLSTEFKTSVNYCISRLLFLFITRGMLLVFLRSPSKFFWAKFESTPYFFFLINVSSLGIFLKRKDYTAPKLLSCYSLLKKKEYQANFNGEKSQYDHDISQICGMKSWCHFRHLIHHLNNDFFHF